MSNHANPWYPEGGGQSIWRRAEHMACPVRPLSWPRSARHTAARAASTTWPVLVVVRPPHAHPAHPGQSKQPNQPVSSRRTQPTRARNVSRDNIPEPPRGVAGHRCACEQLYWSNSCKKWVRTGGSFSMSSLGPRDLPLSLAAQPRSFGRTALRVVGPTVSAPVQVPRTPRKLPPNCGE